MAEFLSELSRGRHAVFSPRANVLVGIARELARRESARGRRVVLCGSGELLGWVFPGGPPSGVELAGDCSGASVASGDLAIVLDAHPPSPPPENVVVLLTRRLRLGRHYKAHAVRWIHGDEYVFETRSEGYSERFAFTGASIEPGPRLGALEARALELLKKSMLEYGELTTKDALFLISRELGVEKEEARRVLSRLVARRYIAIRRGKLELA